jgi:hypothetical protein
VSACVSMTMAESWMARALGLTTGPAEADDCAFDNDVKSATARARQREGNRLYRVMGLCDGCGK